MTDNEIIKKRKETIKVLSGTLEASGFKNSKGRDCKIRFVVDDGF